eukprot:scaffold253262_cov86-Cyclotella_meneghiniana.AAC.1
MGSYKGIKTVRNVVVDCMNNIHPVYNIKRLMIMKELAQDPKLKEESWERFLPTFKKKNVQRRKPHQIKEEEAKSKNSSSANGDGDDNAVKKQKKKKSYTPFPPAQTPSKIDKQLDSGEYFLSEQQRKSKKLAEKRMAGKTKSEEKRKKRQREFEFHPNDTDTSETKKVKVGGNNDDNEKEGMDDVDRLASKFAKKKRKTG